MQQLVILGATGTIGRNTLDVASRHPQKIQVVGVSANRDDAGLFAICQEHRVGWAAMADEAAAQRLQLRLREAGLPTKVLSGAQGLCELAALPEATTVMAAVVGAAGLLPTLAAVEAHKRVLLATKEALVMSGQVFMDALRNSRAELLPIDSEHNAIFQCLPPGSHCGQTPRGVRRLILTASGGPFRTLPMEAFATVTPAQAVAHPNWTMGQKISVDSATMMNKGLELIEAARLFDLPSARIDVLLHPQSVIHSLVEYDDASFLAQIGSPDMRIPIAHAMAWPERFESGAASVDLAEVARMDFEAADLARFPCLRLARESLEAGGTAPAVLNAANEVAVEAFLHEQAAFLDIAACVESTLEAMDSAGLAQPNCIESVLAADAWARAHAAQHLGVSHA
ncbi:1-deoxy-D-xylulose 5-phosphate reductoisomerase [Oceanococcus atlanticus]|uniref:1-deoxy-D-xylulose 5-phosphate reductoisomerase n=1 Tax=Oceanococcus atlanticus TaxID=1317117 RepID=A0A1Y1SED0_9GAMM|nr:1-deoxy-D-xylulose-5-phosphate reductoisomerase [Oceanococcus atlanticus]ORE87033.1 1-deoxy-D-xylulose 5-phosphate reductoisomerase [Oceanococcus atlanticus]